MAFDVNKSSLFEQEAACMFAAAMIRLMLKDYNDNAPLRSDMESHIKALDAASETIRVVESLSKTIFQLGIMSYER
jgi:hypothetical protein